MKEKMKKVSAVLKKIFGYGILICLFGGGFTFFGYAAALIIGGETATAICVFLYKQILPVKPLPLFSFMNSAVIKKPSPRSTSTSKVNVID